MSEIPGVVVDQLGEEERVQGARELGARIARDLERARAGDARQVGGGGHRGRIAAELLDGAAQQIDVAQLLILDHLEVGQRRAGRGVDGEGRQLVDHRLVEPHAGAFEREPLAEQVEKQRRALALEQGHRALGQALERSGRRHRADRHAFARELEPHLRDPRIAERARRALARGGFGGDAIERRGLDSGAIQTRIVWRLHFDGLLMNRCLRRGLFHQLAARPPLIVGRDDLGRRAFGVQVVAIEHRRRAGLLRRARHDLGADRAQIDLVLEHLAHERRAGSNSRSARAAFAEITKPDRASRLRSKISRTNASWPSS